MGQTLLPRITFPLHDGQRLYRSGMGGGDSADEVYMNASSKAVTHIHPTAAKADIILSGEADRAAYRRFITRILALVEEIHYNK